MGRAKPNADRAKQEWIEIIVFLVSFLGLGVAAFFDAGTVAGLLFATMLVSLFLIFKRSRKSDDPGGPFGGVSGGGEG